jgi:hypothetical protein
MVGQLGAVCAAASPAMKQAATAGSATWRNLILDMNSSCCSCL